MAENISASFNKAARPTSARLLGYINPISLRERDRQVFKILRSGQDITSRHLLKMDMGVYPPPGLNIPAAANDNVVAIQSPHQNNGISLNEKMFSLLATGGYVNDPVIDPATGLARPSPRTMFINPLLSSPIGAVMSAFSVYSLVQMTVLFAPISPLVAVLPAALFVVTGFSSLRSALFTSIIDKLYNSPLDTIGHEHTHILQKDDMERGGTGFNLMDNYFKTRLETALKVKAPLRYKFDNALSGNCISNFMQDVEVQARLHTIIAHECREHGRMPMTKHELWAALIDAGLQAPPKVYEALKLSTDKSHETFCKGGIRAAFKRAVRGVADKSTAEMNAVFRAHLFSDLKEKFWEETMPYLYGHLLELYGHSTGRQDMGFSKSFPTPSCPKRQHCA